MKKPTIKRRKRVVPALQDSSSVVNLSPNSLSAIPFTSPQHLRGPFPPPAVDFTGFSPFQRAPTPLQTSQLPQPQPGRQRKKRSMSSVSQASKSPVNPSISDRSPLDPSLIPSQTAHRDQNQNQQQCQPTDGHVIDATESRKAARRAQLAREAEEMRELLVAKERELAELG